MQSLRNVVVVIISVLLFALPAEAGRHKKTGQDFHQEEKQERKVQSKHAKKALKQGKENQKFWASISYTLQLSAPEILNLTTPGGLFCALLLTTYMLPAEAQTISFQGNTSYSHSPHESTALSNYTQVIKTSFDNDNLFPSTPQAKPMPLSNSQAAAAEKINRKKPLKCSENNEEKLTLVKNSLEKQKMFQEPYIAQGILIAYDPSELTIQQTEKLLEWAASQKFPPKFHYLDAPKSIVKRKTALVLEQKYSCEIAGVNDYRGSGEEEFLKYLFESENINFKFITPYSYGGGTLGTYITKMAYNYLQTINYINYFADLIEDKKIFEYFNEFNDFLNYHIASWVEETPINSFIEYCYNITTDTGFCFERTNNKEFCLKMKNHGQTPFLADELCQNINTILGNPRFPEEMPMNKELCMHMHPQSTIDQQYFRNFFNDILNSHEENFIFPTPYWHIGYLHNYFNNNRGMKIEVINMASIINNESMQEKIEELKTHETNNQCPLGATEKFHSLINLLRSAIQYHPKPCTTTKA